MSKLFKRHGTWVIMLLILVMLSVVLEGIYINNTSEELASHISGMRSAYLAEDDVALITSLEAFAARWEELRSPLAILLDHDEIDNIQRALVVLQADVLHGHAESIPSALAELEYYILHAPDLENLSLKNIF